MEIIEDIKKSITEAKNICVIPSQTNEPESLSAALALFYILKELDKNVNLIIDNFPEKLEFLIPSLDFISQPKNFVISIPKDVADVSQVYYEKNEENVKIHLTIGKGSIKKDNISFYYSEAKPDLIITLGIKDFKSELENKLNSFGFILDSPILNIDSLETGGQENKKFGKINLLEEKSISEIIMDMVKLTVADLFTKNVASCILTGMVIYYENFKSANTKPETLKIAAQLMERGANYQQIMENIYKTTESQMKFLSSIFKNLQTENHLYTASLESDEFWNFGESEAAQAVEKIRTLGIQNDLLVLWKTHASPASISGFLYTKKSETISKVLYGRNGASRKDWVFITTPGENILETKEQIVKSLQHLKKKQLHFQ